MMDDVTRLGIDDEAFLIQSMIDRCPRTMMLRELVMNALEAAIKAPEGHRRVEIFGLPIDGARKLAIRNTGPGLSRADLYRACDIGASLGKTKGLDAHFGFGAKVASLGSNPLGVRFRSCAAGLVHEVLLGRQHGQYGRIWRPSSTRMEGRVAGSVDIDDITAVAAAEGYDLTTDWTEVVLLGEREDQDTVADPHAGNPPVPPFWIPKTLFQRFYAIDPSIEMDIGEGLHAQGTGGRRFETLACRRAGHFAQHETVPAENGLRVHYLYDAPAEDGRGRSVSGALQDTAGLIAVLYRGELYDVKTGSVWAYDAPMFGIPFAARRFTVLIELPDDFAAIPEEYRQFLRHHGGQQGAVGAKDFRTTVVRHRPAWLLTLQQDEAILANGPEWIREDLARLMRQLGLPATTRAEGGPLHGNLAEPPMVYVLHDETELRDRWLLGRAAIYMPDSNELFVNGRYQSVLRLVRLTRAALPLDLSEDAEAAIIEGAEHAMAYRVARSVIRAIAKATDQNWTTGNIQNAVAPEALSLVADDLDDALPGLRARAARSAMPAAV